MLKHTHTYLESLSVEADIPVGQLVNKLDQPRHDSIEMVLYRKRIIRTNNNPYSLLPIQGTVRSALLMLTGHFLLDIGNERLCEAEDPPVHHITRSEVLFTFEGYPFLLRTTENHTLLLSSFPILPPSLPPSFLPSYTSPSLPLLPHLPPSLLPSFSPPLTHLLTHLLPPLPPSLTLLLPSSLPPFPPPSLPSLLSLTSLSLSTFCMRNL